MKKGKGKKLKNSTCTSALNGCECKVCVGKICIHCGHLVYAHSKETKECLFTGCKCKEFKNVYEK